jgi:hypothetical protein
VSTNKGEIEIPVFTFLKEKVYGNPPDVDLGRISLEQLGKQPNLLDFRTDTVFIYKHQGEDFRIRVESSLPFIGVQKTPAEGPGTVVNISSRIRTVGGLALAPRSEGTIALEWEEPCQGGLDRGSRPRGRHLGVARAASGANALPVMARPTTTCTASYSGCPPR